MAARRKWDKDHYEKKAQERLAKGDDECEEKSVRRRLKDEFVPAPEGAAGPEGSKRAFIQARSQKVDIEGKVGTSQVITAKTPDHEAGGYYCDVCQCLLKDSMSYLDHINGKKHQRKLGYSMRVERASVNKVKERLRSLKRKAGEDNSVIQRSAEEEYDERLARAAVEEERLKKLKKEALVAKKKEQEAKELEHVDPEIAALMGFGSFGGGKNK